MENLKSDIQSIICEISKVDDPNYDIVKVYKYANKFKNQHTDPTILLLLWTANIGDLSSLKLLSKRIYINKIINQLQSISLAKGHLPIIKYFFNNIDKINFNLDDAINTASEHGHLEIVKYLVQNGANVNYALTASARGNNLPIVKYVVRNGADVHSDCDGALESAAENNNLKMVKFLIKNGIEISSYDWLAFRTAAKSGSLDVVKYFIKNGAETEARNVALCRSAENGKVDIVKYLVSVRTDINCKNGAALSMSAFNGHTKIVDFLVTNGAIVNLNYHSALLYALSGCCRKPYQIIKIIAEKYVENCEPIPNFLIKKNDTSKSAKILITYVNPDQYHLFHPKVVSNIKQIKSARNI